MNEGTWYAVALVMLMGALTLTFTNSEEVSAHEQPDLHAHIEFVPEEVCYEGAGELVKPEYMVRNLLVTMHWLPADHDDPEADGWSECITDVENDIAWCDVYVILPTHVLGDPQMDALGHEVFHGLSGSFHKE